MAAKTRTIKNATKVNQVYYDRHRNPITLKPGESFTEDLSGVIDVNALVRQEEDRRRLEVDVDEAKRVRKALALVRVSKSAEDLDKLRTDEKNPDVLDAILVREKEILDDAGRIKGKA